MAYLNGIEPGGGLALPQGVDPNSKQFKEAESHCKQYLPSGSTINLMNPEEQWSSADKLKYAQCMRENGVPKFPDPDSNGGFSFMKDSGIDPDSPQFKQAQTACKKYQPQSIQNMTPNKPGGGS